MTTTGSTSAMSAKLLLGILGLAALLVSDAGAAPRKQRTTAVPQAAAQSTPTCRGANLFHCGPIYSSGDYLGTDPDPFIRLMIQRDLGVKYGGSP